MTDPIHAELSHLVSRGEMLAAYDRATELLEDHPHDATLRFVTALSLARTGALEQAGAELANIDDAVMAAADNPRLEEDVAALRARLVKDAALTHTGKDKRRSATEASRLYEDVCRMHGSHFACINAATMAAIAGQTERATALAQKARSLVSHEPTGGLDEEESYWRAATRAEAALLLGELDAARAALREATLRSVGRPALRATTRRQLRLICDESGTDPALLDELPVPAVVHYTGHRFTGTDVDQSALRGAVNDKLSAIGAGIAYGSLAYGADILVAEEVLARGDQLHVVLPCPADQFVEWSVAPGAGDWLERFNHCMESASSVSTEPSHAPFDDPEMYVFGSRLAMGHAVIRAEVLTGAAVQLALWDGEDGDSEAGTASDVRFWRKTGRATEVVPCSHPDIPANRVADSAGPPRDLRAMVFADFHGFSTLDERQIPTFFESVMGALADSIDASGDDVLYRNSWGDGLYLVYRTVSAATSGALALQRTFGALDLNRLDLPEMGLRIGVHAGPVYAGTDPIRREPSFFGTHVIRTARIEPRTPPGEVYMTASSAALLALDPVPGMIPEYVGHIDTAKDYGAFPMYVLKRR